jgi:SAM-dependent methyltransferase
VRDRPQETDGAREVKVQEREWQNLCGGSLQELAHARRGTREVLEVQHRRIARALGIAPGERVLDLGCGTGRLLASLSRHAPGRYHGLDLSLGSLQTARRTEPACSCAVGDAEGLPFRDSSFDAVVCNGAAHHFLDLPAALSEIRRVLRPGGTLLLYEPIATPFAEFVRRTLSGYRSYESPADLARKQEFDRVTVQHTVREQGFDVVESTLHDFLAYPLSGMYMGFPWSRSQRFMLALLWLERQLERLRPMRRVWDVFAWRLLLVARRAA